jgi:competence protein ComEC
MARHVGAIDGKSGGLATAVLIGDRTGLSKDDERRLQEAGTYHVVAISGGNIAILAALMVGAGRVLMAGGRSAAVVTCAVLLFYGVVAAGAASVSRAVAVAVLILGARAADHRGSSLNALAVAAVVAVAAVPAVALDAGFILSFGATLGILLGMPRLVPVSGQEQGGRKAGGGLQKEGSLQKEGWEPGGRGKGDREPDSRQQDSHPAGRENDAWEPGGPPPGGREKGDRKIARRGGAVLMAVAAVCAASLCAEAALLPVGATLFARVPLAGLVLNLAAIPLMTIVQIGGLLVAATGSWWDAGARVSATVTHLAALGLLRSAEVMDVAPWLALDVRPPSLWLVGAYYAAALALVALPIRRTAALVLAGSTALILAGPAWTTRGAVPASGFPLRVVVLDVGQGDATLIGLPNGAALLVDGGGLAPLALPASAAPGDPAQGFDIGERVVAPALRALGVRRLQGVVITHGDPDHILGVAGVLRHASVGSIWEGVPVPPHPGLQGLLSVARTRGVSWRTVQSGDRERFGDVEIRVLHPPPPDWERQRVRNEDSVVLEIRLGDVSVILPGDIGREGERAILRRLEPGRLVVLKAPHHGSATSSTRELLELLRPGAVIFSCGRDNRFGHPHPAVVARYRDVGADVFSTAEDGAVFVETDGTTVALRGWTGRRATLTSRVREHARTRVR